MSASSDGSVRLGGLISGIDTQGIIEQLLAVERAKIDKVEEKKELNSAKIDTWNDVQDQLKSLATSIQTLRADGTTGSTLYDDKIVASSDSDTATATANTSAAAATYTVSVANLARPMVAYGTQKAANYTLGAAGSVVLNGTTVNFAGGETLEEMAILITNASYATGESLIASVVDDRLVLQSESGASKTIYGTTAGAPPFVAGDDPNNILNGELGLIDGTFNLTNVAQTSLDASLTVNGIPITRETNSFDDVVDNVTITLASAGSTQLTVGVNKEPIKNAITDFVELYNETRDFIERIRSAKLDEDEDFGPFFSDPLLRELFNNLRTLTSTGVVMGDDNWDGAVTAAAAAQGDTSLTLNNFTNATGTLKTGDQFVIDGDSTIYTVNTSTSIAANSATVSIKPPLEIATAGGESINLAIRTLEDFGVGTRTDEFSGIQGVLGILDEGQLDSMLETSLSVIKQIFTRTGDTTRQEGIARRLYDFIDSQTKIGFSVAAQRTIDNIKIPGLETENERLDDQIERLEERLAQKEASLIRQFTQMERAMAQSQSAGSALSSLAGGGSSQQQG